MHHLSDRIEQWGLLARDWTKSANEHGRSRSPAAQRMRTRSLALCTLLLALRKRLNEAVQIADQISKLIADEAVADIIEERAA